jgi:3-hydroxybutyryl-CoA dehydrogenase
MPITKIGIVGCGQMGSGIAEVSLRAGYNVIVSEVNIEFLDRGMAGIKNALTRAVERNRMKPDEMTNALAHLQGTTSLADFKDRELVIEAATENMTLKKQTFAELDKVCLPDAILATNTSCLSIIDIAMATKRPAKILGIHFFNPVQMMKLVELVRSILTSDETMASARQFGESVGKTVVVAPDNPGFIVNRLLVPYLLDAIHMLETKVASKEDIDQGIVLGCNHPMGPLTLADFIGLDTVLYIADAMYQEYKTPPFAAPVLLRKMVTAGELGRKTKKGFYNY